MSTPRTDVLQRVMNYCAESERCTHDVLSKLVSWGVPLEESEIILTKLRTEKFLDDVRYTKSYVSEKWNTDHWGKIKIENSLLQKNISEEIIRHALSGIDDNEYIQVLHEMLRKKLREVSSENKPDDARRVMMYALSRGFEEELVMEWLEKGGHGLMG